jgi:hypothetical protein
MQGKRATNCAANPFWMAKLILLNTTSWDLGDTTLLCMALWTLFNGMFFFYKEQNLDDSHKSQCRQHLKI